MLMTLDCAYDSTVLMTRLYKASLASSLASHPKKCLKTMNMDHLHNTLHTLQSNTRCIINSSAVHKHGDCKLAKHIIIINQVIVCYCCSVMATLYPMFYAIHHPSFSQLLNFLTSWAEPFCNYTSECSILCSSYPAAARVCGVCGSPPLLVSFEATFTFYLSRQWLFQY